MGTISISKQNPAVGGLRIARIQYTSLLRNQNLYFSHKYDVKVNMQHIYTQMSSDFYCRLQCSTNGIIAEATSSAFYIYDSGSYVDICVNVKDNYSRVIAQIDTSELGSVSVKCDNYSLEKCTRLTIIDPLLNVMFNKIQGKTYQYYQDFSMTKILKFNNVDTFQIAINGDVAIISENEIIKKPTNWTLTKGNDVIVGGEVVGSNYSLITTGTYRGSVIIY